MIEVELERISSGIRIAIDIIKSILGNAWHERLRLTLFLRYISKDDNRRFWWVFENNYSKAVSILNSHFSTADICESRATSWRRHQRLFNKSARIDPGYKPFPSSRGYYSWGHYQSKKEIKAGLNPRWPGHRNTQRADNKTQVRSRLSVSLAETLSCNVYVMSPLGRKSRRVAEKFCSYDFKMQPYLQM